MPAAAVLFNTKGLIQTPGQADGLPLFGHYTAAMLLGAQYAADVKRGAGYSAALFHGAQYEAKAEGN